MSAITNRQMNKNERQVLPAKTTANLKKRNRKQFEADRIEENQTAQKSKFPGKRRLLNPDSINKVSFAVLPLSQPTANLQPVAEVNSILEQSMMDNPSPMSEPSTLLQIKSVQDFMLESVQEPKLEIRNLTLPPQMVKRELFSKEVVIAKQKQSDISQERHSLQNIQQAQKSIDKDESIVQRGNEEVLEIAVCALRTTKEHHERVMTIEKASQLRQRSFSEKINSILESTRAFLNQPRTTYFMTHSQRRALAE